MGKKVLRNKIISTALAAAMVLGCLIPSNSVFAEGEGVLTITTNTELDGSDVTDDSGALCSVNSLSKLEVTNRSTCTITSNSFGNSSLQVDATGYGSALYVGSEGNRSATLNCNYADGTIKNYGTINTAGIYFHASSSATTYRNYGTINASDMVRVSYAACKLYNETGASVTAGTIYVGRNSDFINNGNVSVDNLELENDDSYGGRFENNGTFQMDNFSVPDDSKTTFTNNGTVTTKNTTVNTAYHNVSNSGTFLVTDSLEINGSTESNAGTFTVLPNTTITSQGPIVTLKIDGLGSKQLSGAISGEKAINILGQDITLTFDNPGAIYAGQDYDVTSFVHGIPADYDGDVAVTYYKQGGTSPSSIEYTAVGNYLYRIVLSGSSKYKDYISSNQAYTISYLPVDQCYISGTTNLVTYSGLHNSKYVADYMTITPASGFQISDNFDGGFAGSYSIYDYDSTDTFVLKRSDGAETDYIGIDTLAPEVSGFIFDEEAPFISNIIMADDVMTEIPDGGEIVAKKVKLTASDENLDRIVTTDASCTEASGGIVKNADGTSAEITIEGIWGDTKDVTVTAYDKADRETSFSLTLGYPLQDASASVSIADVFIGTDYEPVLTTDSDGKSDASFLYKEAGADDSTYTYDKPAKAGSYIVKAMIPETAKYNEISCTGTFSIKKLIPAVAEVKVEDTLYGGEYSPVLSTDSDGAEGTVFEYKVISSPDNTFTTVKPTAAGEYAIRATIPETDTYASAICSGTFKISRYTVGETKVEVSDVYVGTEVMPVLTTDSDGKGNAAYEYKLEEADDSAYTADKPFSAGTYTVRVTIPETDKYESSVCYGSFTIMKRVPVTAVVSVANIKVGETVSPVVDTDSDGKDGTTFEFKAVDADDSEYAETLPVKAGKYSVRASIPETDMFVGVVCESTFTISKNKPVYVNLQISDGLVGTDLSPVFDTDSDGKALVVIEYKNKDAADSTYSKTKPTQHGTYVARATVPETDAYESGSCTAEFSMDYLEAPVIAYVLSGVEGKNDFYTSDVAINAPDGFTVSKNLGGVYTSSVLYVDGLNLIYLKRTSDGAMTDAVKITKEIKIDKLNPAVSVMTDQDGKAVVGENKVYADTLNVKITDDNLDTVLLDGSDVSVSDNAGTAFLDSENGEKTFNILAEDKAGNKLSTSITLTATWLLDKVIPANKLLPLTPGQSYKLDAGQWTVDGDSTVYNGGFDVYVDTEGSHTFTQTN